MVVVVWRNSLHGKVKSQDEIIEIEAEAQTVARSQLLVEGVKMKLSAWLRGVVASIPNVARINE